MRVETQKGKLAYTAVLFVAFSLGTILLCRAAIAPHHRPAQRSINVPIYTYQNPFSVPDAASSGAISQADSGRAMAKLISGELPLALSGLGVLWLALTRYRKGAGKIKKRVYQKAANAARSPAKMNPLAVLPKPAIHDSKEDTFYVSPLRPTTTSSSLAHRKVTAPCQSRFRPVKLVSSRPRFGRLY